MDLNTCIKFLHFISGEADRYLKSRSVKDQNLIALTTELENFKNKSAASDLPAELKSRIANLKMDYSYRKVKFDNVMMIVAVLTIGLSALFVYYAQQSKRKKALKSIRDQTSSLLLMAKMNY